MNTPEYLSIIENIKSEIKAAQYRATIHANSDLLLLYYCLLYTSLICKAAKKKFNKKVLAVIGAAAFVGAILAVILIARTPMPL